MGGHKRRSRWRYNSLGRIKLAKLKNMTDPFFQLYGDIQEIWNDKKGLDWTNNIRAKKQILKKLEKFVNTLPDRQEKLRQVIQMQRDYIKFKEQTSKT